MTTNRLEAFSDGVIAVAITLLALGITVPEIESGEGLGHALLAHWPQYAAYVVSFLTIGIVWVNHHAMIGRLREADHSILMLNLALLMTIAVLPFGTDLMAHYLRSGESQHVAAAVYAGLFALMALAFCALDRHLLIDKAHLLHDELPLSERRLILRRAAVGVVPYLVATGLAFVSAYVTLGICAALGVFYSLPVASSSQQRPGR